MNSHRIIPIRAFQDNYIWLIQQTKNAAVWVVDPGDAAPVIDRLQHADLTLAGILLTHHHRDHSGGIAELLSTAKNVPVVASWQSAITQITHPVRQDDEVSCEMTLFQVLEIPGHTLDHIAFYTPGILFCGDTLFSAGCGKVFEGTYAEMYASLQKLKCLPDQTHIFCGHEYTLSNLSFAAVVEPQNTVIQAKLAWAKSLAENKQPTLPSTLFAERQMNPFLRCHEKNVWQAVEQQWGRSLLNEQEVFQCLREWKNVFPN